MDPTKILTDVIALSHKLCVYPIRGSLAYATKDNFLGRIVDGYSEDATDVCLLSRQAAYALCHVQNDLNKQQLGLYIYDAYRPLRAVKDFAKWFTEPPANKFELEKKKMHYPNLNKTDLGPMGYTPSHVSKHNFGTAVDLTLISLENFLPLNMGACFDFFDEISHHSASNTQIGEEAFNNRAILLRAMQAHGFVPYPKEYWHYDYQIREVTTPMDLQIVSELKNLNAL